MNDRAVSLLGQYDIEVLRTRKGRGAILCDTNQGCLIFKEYAGNENKIRIQDRLLNHIRETGKIQVESILPTREGSLFVKDMEGNSYVLKTYAEGRECNIYEKKECLEAVRVLARLHGCMELSQTEMDGLPADGFFAGREYEKHNRELRRVRKYLKQRGQKTGFEIGLLNSFDYFLEQALAVTEEWNRYRLENSRGHERKETVLYCHGDYQYHNILWGQEEWFVVNFEKCLPDNPIRDLYLFLRKLLEKSSWSVSLGKELLAAYQEERPISDESRMDLYYRLAYPEKFWKIVNFYYNSGKAWIPERNREKLEKLVVQEKEKQIFLDEIFQRR
ncbi:MAG TPA: CotS family spore coat protein [Candidatus Acetatifactor stercoripullorum]|uniref:CotS family spore coat protein n=1 Tax=Candidatus Acetatifactor stercoripullorum TaxID=2838414 RepID=A0A9D1UC42_9FIRM|nr:CotS family spore coat protein [Candidatus Acetatifactor stercoripullorum]HIW80985.1 CotS family spore coat protein [Candidatus Acetatifactor stercoripullorum]